MNNPIGHKPDFYPTRSSEEFRVQACTFCDGSIVGTAIEMQGYPDLLRERECDPSFAPIKAKQ